MNGAHVETDYIDENVNAAVHRKVPGADQSQSAFLKNLASEQQNMHFNDDRPTSGKHFARNHEFSKRKGELEQPNSDPMTSAVAKNHETSKKVESLLNRLANYMAGEVPENADITSIFPDAKSDGGEMEDGADDATTNYTKDEPARLPKLNQLSLEPIYAPPLESPKSKHVTASIEEQIPEPPPKKIIQILEEEEPPQEEKLPSIFELMETAGKKKQKETSLSRIKEKKIENMFIYKDFETGLTKVKTSVTRLPSLN